MSSRHCLPLFFPVIVLGSIYAGWATPTESAAISLVYVTIIEMFLYRTVKVREYVEMFFTGLLNSGCLLAIIAAATALSWLVSPDADSRAGNRLRFRAS